MAAETAVPTVHRMVGRDERACVRVVLVSHRPDVRRALEIRLALERDVLVTGSEASLAAALHRLRGSGPIVLLVDRDGCTDLTDEALQRARSAARGLRVLLLTHHAGAPGCGPSGVDFVLDKVPDASPLLAAIRGTAQGFV